MSHERENDPNAHDVTDDLNAQSCRSGWVFWNRKEKRAVPFRCRSWRCPDCAPRKARLLTERITSEAKRLHLRRFITLTLRAGVHPGHAVDHLWTAWRTLRDELAKEGPLTAIAVVEFTKLGTAHLHVLTDRWIHFARLSRLWQEASGSSVVYIQHVDEQNASTYVSKYLGKALAHPAVEYPFKRRRYSGSRETQLSLSNPPSGLWTIAECVGETTLLTSSLDLDFWGVHVRVRGSPRDPPETAALQITIYPSTAA